MADEAAEREGRSYWGMSARRCDSCRSAPALLFCRADSAFLCGGCDAQVHGANKLASRHERVWMCEVCEQAPAAVTCKADAAALCLSCDADIHSANPLARRHDRVPVQPFFDFLPKQSANSKTLEQQQQQQQRNEDEDEDEDDEEDEDNNNDEDEDRENGVEWLRQESKFNVMEGEGPPHMNLFLGVDPSLDLDYAASMDAGGFNQTADSVVPNHGPVQAVHHVPAVPFFGAPQDHSTYGVDLGRSRASNYVYPPPSLSHSVSSSEVGVVPDASAMGEISNPYVTGVPVNPATMMGHPAAAVGAIGMDREARVMRYREKRKNRKFEKTIRYASRKAYAETRPRIKGRFAKRTDTESVRYGVVPTF